MARDQTLLKAYEKVRPKQKRIMKGRNNRAIYTRKNKTRLK